MCEQAFTTQINLNCWILCQNQRQITCRVTNQTKKTSMSCMKNLSQGIPIYSKKTQGDNELTLTWYADTSDWAIIPAVKYKDTELTLNGKKLNDKDYSLSGIGTPTVMQKAGKNTLTITYHISTWFKALIVVNILSWLATLAYLIKKKTMK